jgi:hypothetical protein
MSIAQNFPEIRPSLNLDFANVKALDPRVTFARASTATYYGTQTAKAEENLLLRSQEFDNAAWNRQAVGVTANTDTAPNGNLTADTFTIAAGAGVHAVTQSQPALTGGRVVSIFAKAGTHKYIQFSFNGDATPWANFDLTAGSGAVGSTGSNQTASIVDAGNGWYRCILYTASTTATNYYLTFVDSSTSARQQDWTAAGTETVYLWGAQLEQRSAPTAYTATTTQPITNYIPVLQTASANVARFDHDPVTGESLGLLVEELRTNLLTYSEQFDNAAWTKNNSSIVSNTIVALDGTLTGDKLVEDTANAQHFIIRSVGGAVAQGAPQTLSLYAKAGERTVIRVENVQGGGRRFFVDLSTGVIASASTIGSTGLDSFSESVTNVGNGWWRIISTIDPTVGSTSSAMTAMVVQGSSTTNYTGDGYSGVYIWGAQLEAGAFPTSYIPTVASQVTRSADSASMTGANFSDWYRQDEGTVYSESFSPADSITGIFNHNWTLSQDGNNFIGCISSASYGGSGNNLSVRVNNTAQLGMVVGQQGSYNKNVLTVKTNDSKGTANGVSVQTDTNCLLPAPTSLHLGGSGFSASNTRSTHIKKFAYYAKALTASQLQALTS